MEEKSAGNNKGKTLSSEKLSTDLFFLIWEIVWERYQYVFLCSLLASTIDHSQVPISKLKDL